MKGLGSQHVHFRSLGLAELRLKDRGRSLQHRSCFVLRLALGRQIFKPRAGHDNVTNSERDTPSEAVISLRTVVTFVTWLISRTKFLV